MSPLRVYIAAPKSAVARARRVARQLTDAGIVVTSSWLTTYADGEPDPPLGSSEALELTERQRCEISDSQAMLALTAEGAGRQTYVEIGVALAREIYVVWSREHGGLALAASSSPVVVCRTDDAAIEAILLLAPEWWVS